MPLADGPSFPSVLVRWILVCSGSNYGEFSSFKILPVLVWRCSNKGQTPELAWCTFSALKVVFPRGNEAAVLSGWRKRAVFMARTGSARCDRVCGACSGTAWHFPQLPAQHPPTSMKLSLLEGERRKKERLDTLIIILCSSSCQVTHQAVAKHVRLPPSHHVIQFGGNRSGHVCQMTEQMWHLKICQLCSWTILEEKVN